ncbi:MAG: OadG family transporter subunit [Bacteroidaceae bacterium]|nr:OadG family transporter subunit [Bacteroidaceae bacterium]
MMILATKWTTAWLMTGLGFGAVFSILVLLVLLLQIFSYVAAKSEVKPKAAAKKAPAKDETKQKVEGYEEDMAAVATAVYLYLNSAHDEESGVLTIQNDDRSLWHAELNASV